MKKNIILLFIMGVFFQESYAQYPKIHFGLGPQAGIPTGDFRKNTSANGFGVYLSAYFPLIRDNIPLYYGLELGTMNYGSINSHIRQVVNVNTGMANFTIPLNYSVYTRSNILSGHFVLRLIAPTSTVRPYLDLMVGTRYIYTYSWVSNGSSSSNVLLQKTLADDLIFSYGPGIGIQYGEGILRFDFRTAYLFGGEAEYLDRDALQQATIQNGGIQVVVNPNATGSNNYSSTINYTNLTVKRSDTDMLYISLGIIIALGIHY